MFDHVDYEPHSTDPSMPVVKRALKYIELESPQFYGNIPPPHPLLPPNIIMPSTTVCFDYRGLIDSWHILNYLARYKDNIELLIVKALSFSEPHLQWPVVAREYGLEKIRCIHR